MCPSFRETVIWLVDIKNVTCAFSVLTLDPTIVKAADERDGEMIDGVEKRVFFRRLVVTQSSLAALMTTLPRLDTDGLLEVTWEDVT